MNSAANVAIGGQRFAVIGVIVGFLALATAALPLWVLPVMFPPKPLDHVLADTAQRVKERLTTKAAGTVQPAPVESDPAEFWYQTASIATVTLGLCAIVLAVVAFLRREDRRYVGVALALGAVAIAFKVALAAIGAVIALALLGTILSALGLV